MENKDQQKSEFIREQIKDKPVNKKKAMTKLGFSALCGLVFALVAAVGFALIEPMISKRMHSENEISELSEVLETQIVEETETQEITEIQEETELQTQQPENPTEMPLTIDEYQKLQDQLYAIGNKNNKAIVTVTSVYNITDWFNQSYEKEGQGCGVIIEDTGSEILILTEYAIITDPERIRVTFINNASFSATLKDYDGNTGLAVLSVERKNLDAKTVVAYSVAKFGNSNSVSKGDIVLALGSPLGTNYSILNGSIISTDDEIETIDHNYSVLTTNITAGASGSGILINTKGEIIGVIMRNYNTVNGQTLTAVSSSQLQKEINMLKAGEKIPYLGLLVTTVTDQIASQYDIPKGVYIKEAIMDSPAMTAGLQSGDVITEVNGEKVASASSYSMYVMKQKPKDVIPVTVERQGADGYSSVICTVEVGVLP